MNCKRCFRCNKTYPSSADVTPDGFGDSSVVMCHSCMSELETDHSRFVLVKTPDYIGTTFVLKQELEDLKKYWGRDQVTVLTPIE